MKSTTSKQYSLQSLFFISTAFILSISTFSVGYSFYRFYEFEDKTHKILSGDHKSILSSQILEADLTALDASVDSSVGSKEENDSFKEKTKKIIETFEKAKLTGLTDSARSEIKTALTNAANPKSDVNSDFGSGSDLFVHYRNIKTSVFNLYRICWANKWMGVAKGVGLILNDLDNMPYHSAEKTSASIFSKITQLTVLVTSSPLSQDAKIQIFNQLNAIKQLVNRYNEDYQVAEKFKNQRHSFLAQAISGIKKYNQSQAKGLISFTDDSSSVIYQTLMAIAFLFLLSFIVLLVFGSIFNRRILSFSKHLNHQIFQWIGVGGNFNYSELSLPEKIPAEFFEFLKSLDQSMRKVAILRKEDQLIKKMLSIPVVLIHQNKQVLYWNSAFSLMFKSKNFEEIGVQSVTSVLKLLNQNGTPIDLNERIFENQAAKDVFQFNAYLSDKSLIEATCVPMFATGTGADAKPEYYFIQFKDLKAESKKINDELNNQLSILNHLLAKLRSGENIVTQISTEVEYRPPVLHFLNELKSFSLELSEKSEVLLAQVENMRERMAREAVLKKNVWGRMLQMKDQTEKAYSHFSVWKQLSIQLKDQLNDLRVREESYLIERKNISLKVEKFFESIQSQKMLIQASLQNLQSAFQAANKVRTFHKSIIKGIEQANLGNINNGILVAGAHSGSFSLSQVTQFTENTDRVVKSLETVHRQAALSMIEFENICKELEVKLLSKLNQCQTMSHSEEKIFESVIQKASSEQNEFLSTLTQTLSQIQEISSDLSTQMLGIENKSKNLAQIGQASVDLQTHIESGFEGIIRHSKWINV